VFPKFVGEKTREIPREAAVFRPHFRRVTGHISD
jgi:hypothetical protein